MLLHRHVSLSLLEDLCLWCHEHVESIFHPLLHCQWTNTIWKNLFLWWGVEWVLPQTFHQFVRDWNEGMSPWLSKGWKLVGPCTIWYVWLARNNLVFNNKVTCWSDTVTRIKHKSFQWALDSKMFSSNDFHMWMSQLLSLFGPNYNS